MNFILYKDKTSYFMGFGILKMICFSLFLFLISFSSFSFAATPKCTGAEPYSPVKVTLPSQITITPELEIGEVIGTATSSFPYGVTTTHCSILGSKGTVPINGTGTPNGIVYPTTIPGIGYRAKMTTPWSVTGIYNEYWPVVGSYSGAPWTYDGSYAGGTFSIDLIKTGTIPGNITWIPGDLGTLQVETGGVTYNFIKFYSNDPIPIKPLNPACKVTNAVIPVELEPVSATSLKTTGSTAGEKSIIIPLRCSIPVRISLAFDGNFADSENSVLINTGPDSNKNNVGIQVLDSADNPLPATANIGAVNGGVNYELKARYYALTDGVPAGSVSSTIYATILYN
ncbi:fimbrial protein [Enterobacter asburiae]|uniref:fimbrial protein n=1 Tax=Enterobacter cloacae complex TaxID=354276 RepID=UPI000F86E114|nr:MULTISPECIES: fimbrial protein [Enterobacter cloacae complex]MBE4893091.1 fimbrial protein [Enterobacter cloacae complex sp. P16RS2]RTP94000.1 fimbrial protein [Enterobacter asburiae]